ncbi:unnamed protein product [Thelazia callipaeda]|uniref:Uncharacterized protein n=1 Tax=Thelazia callipaeda TaxID=103827 RepID=A0A0N5CM17_THECL|nr:unnamed protein product [Thelazia callipaeda]
MDFNRPEENMVYNFCGMQQCCDEMVNNVHYKSDATTFVNVDSEEQNDWNSPSSYFELNKSVSVESRINEAALLLKQTMELQAPHLICDRRGHSQVFNSELKSFTLYFFTKFLTYFVWNQKFVHFESLK